MAVIGAVLLPARRPAGFDDLDASTAPTAPRSLAAPVTPVPTATSVPTPAPDSATVVPEVPSAEMAPTTNPVASSLDDVTEVLTEVAATADAAAPPTSTGPVEPDPTLVTLVLTDDGHLQLDRVPLEDGIDLAAVAADVVADGELVAASIDATVQLDQPEAVLDGTAIAASTNDAYRSQQWALDHVPFETAWSSGNGGGVIVAVVDTAVDLTHPDLAGQFVAGYHFLAAGSGPGVASAPPGNFHGTHVAGIIAAVANNGTGMAGGAPGAKIMPIEVLDAAGSGRYSDITAGIIYAADHGARVINLSLGGSSQSSTLDAAVAYALAHGAVVMAAAGNAGCSVGPSCSANYPAASPGATAVGSITSALACSSFTTRASYVALGAPGSSILSTAPESLVAGGYALASGTSMATPYASAAAATVLSAQPGASAEQVVSALVSTAIDVADGGPDTCTGAGLIDPLAAVESLSGAGPSPTTTIAPASLVAPRLAGALVGRGMVRLSFQSPAGASLIMIHRDGTLLATVAATRRSYTDRAVNPRQEYTYTVTAFADSFGESPVSVARTVTTRG